VTLQKGPRTNEKITSPQVRLIGSDGTNMGIVPIAAALAAAIQAGFDLVEISPEANPPVCRLADAGKLRYEASIKAKEARRGASRITVKELKYRPTIDNHDYETKMNWAKKFLGQGHPVKVTVMLRGREQGRPEMADRIFERLVSDLAELGQLRGSISRMGRDVIATFEPRKPK
jgi:translation initiation factor IF-3